MPINLNINPLSPIQMTVNTNDALSMSAEEARIIHAVSPKVEMEEITGGTKLTITDVDGDHETDIMDGADGSSAYVWIKWSAVQPTQDSDMKDTADAYIGIYSGDSSTAPTAYTSYTWYQYKGAKGDQGIQGIQGETGDTGATPVISIGTVSTLTPGSSATASMDTTDPAHPVLSLGIPEGQPGNATIDDTSVANNKVWSAQKVNDLKSATSDLGETNLFSLTDSEFGYIGSTGAVTNSYANNNITSDYIPVEPGEKYFGHVWFESTATGNLGICFAAYDSNKDFVSGSRVNRTAIDRTFNGKKEIWNTYTVPEGAAYIRFCGTICQQGYIQLERGGVRSMWKENTNDVNRVQNRITNYVYYGEIAKYDYLRQIDWEQGSLSSGAPSSSTSNMRMKDKIPITSPIMMAEYDSTTENIVVSFYSSTADNSFLKEITIASQPFIVVPVGTKYIRVRVAHSGPIYNPVDLNYRLVPVLGEKPLNGEDFFDSLVWKQGIFNTSNRTIADASDKITSMPFYFGGDGVYKFIYNSIYVDSGNSIWTRVHCFSMDGTRVVFERQAAYQTTPWFFHIPNDGICGFFEVQRAGGGNIAPSDMQNAQIEAEKTEYTPLKNLRLLTHNIGHFNYGGSGSGTTNYGIPAPYASNLKLWKDQLASVRPDVWGIQEYTEYLSQEDHTKKITDFISPLFLSLMTYGSDYGVASNIYPFSNGYLTIGSADRTVQHLKFYIGNGKFLNYINVHLNYSDLDIRVSEIQSLITQMQNEENVIIAGDFNEATTSEADAFVTAGYTKCNGGFFGDFITYDNTGSVETPLDQIVFKGNIKLTNMERKPFVTSDHYALMCDFVID